MSEPVAIQAGLSRSGSTVVWQMMTDLLSGPVCKTHAYADYGNLPCVVTVRHPLDAAASLWRVHGRDPDVDPLAAVENTAREVVRFIDQHTGPVLTVRYESWWPDMGQCLHTIAQFLGVPFDNDLYGRIILRRNVTANKAIADRVGTWSQHDAETLIHGLHVGTGRPGNRDELPAPVLLRGSRTLAGFMERFGYTL